MAGKSKFHKSYTKQHCNKDKELIKKIEEKDYHLFLRGEQVDFLESKIQSMTESIGKLIEKVDEKRMDVFRNPFYRNAYGWIIKELRQTLKENP